VRLRRAIVVLMSAQGQATRNITHLMKVSDDYVRDVIHAFNERGFDALDPKWSGGRPPTIDQTTREQVCLIARTSPPSGASLSSPPGVFPSSPLTWSTGAW
jgi:transposase